MDITTIYWIVLAIMAVGIIGAVIPGLPGSSFILFAILLGVRVINLQNTAVNKNA